MESPPESVTMVYLLHNERGLIGEALQGGLGRNERKNAD